MAYQDEWRVEAIKRETNGKIVGYRAVKGLLPLIVDQEATFYNRKGRSLHDCEQAALAACRTKNIAQREAAAWAEAEARAAAAAKPARVRKRLTPAEVEVAPEAAPAGPGEPAKRVRKRLGPIDNQPWRVESRYDETQGRVSAFVVVRGPEGPAQRYRATYNCARFAKARELAEASCAEGNAELVSG